MLTSNILWNTRTTTKDIFYIVILFRSSRPEVFCKKGVLRNFTKFSGKHLCQNLFFNKVAGLRPATLLKKNLWHSCFPVNFAKFLRTAFLTEHLRVAVYVYFMTFMFILYLCTRNNFWRCQQKLNNDWLNEWKFTWRELISADQFLRHFAGLNLCGWDAWCLYISKEFIFTVQSILIIFNSIFL